MAARGDRPLPQPVCDSPHQIPFLTGVPNEVLRGIVRRAASPISAGMVASGFGSRVPRHRAHRGLRKACRPRVARVVLVDAVPTIGKRSAAEVIDVAQREVDYLSLVTASANTEPRPTGHKQPSCQFTSTRRTRMDLCGNPSDPIRLNQE